MFTLKAALAGTVMSFLLLMSCIGQATREDRRFESEWELSVAPVEALVQRRILATLFADHKDGYEQDEQDQIRPIALRSVVKFVRLDRRGRVGIEVKTVSPWCGATGNCEVYVFDSRTADLLVKDGGWDFGFRQSTHHGVYDFYTRSNTSAGSGTRVEYEFDGEVYRRVRSISGAHY
jgi:hypothetical protein